MNAAYNKTNKIIEIDPLAFLLRDARHLQILFLGTFLFFGIHFLGWEQDNFKYLTLFTTSICTQILFCYAFKKDLSSIKSAIITALGLSLLLKANHLSTYVLAATVAIASKFILQYKGKHFFNPANLAIAVSILLTNDAWVSPGQWGNAAILIFLVGSLGVAVTLKVEKFDTSMAFLLVFLGLEFYRNVIYKDWPLDFFVHQISNGALLLFSFFMITDPVSTPNSKIARWIWASSIGVLAFYLANFHFINAAPIWALFILSPTTLLLDQLFSESSFKWTK